MRTSICLKIMAFLGGMILSNAADKKEREVCKAWIPVPWSHGGHYWHNTITREDRDTRPPCRDEL